MRSSVSPGMNYRRETTTHMEAQNTLAAGFNGLDIAGYTYLDPSATDSSTQDALGIPAAYSVNDESGGPYHQDRNGQSNSRAAHMVCVGPQDHDTPQAQASHFLGSQNIASNEVTLYVPVPCSGHQSLLLSGGVHYDYANFQEQPPSEQAAHESLFSTFQEHRGSQTTMALTGASCFNGLQYSQGANQSATSENPYYQDDTSTRTFPTPSELLVELTNSNHTSADGTYCHTNGNSSDLSRRPRRRTVSRGLGLISGDSSIRETITSHEKKRQYLECLEHYVMFLHQQLNLVGAEPVPLERVPRYRGLNNRSIRTLLVHMENATKALSLRTLREEQRFVDLRDAVYRQDATAVQTLQNQTIASAEANHCLH